MARPLIVFQMDTNCLNAKQGMEPINKLEKWAEDEHITLVWSQTAQEEAKNNNKPHLHKKANTHIYTIEEEDDSNTNPENIKIQVFSIMGINENSSQSEINDAKIICEAAKYCAVLVTNDGASKNQPTGILGRKHELSRFVRIMSPDEAVAHVQKTLGI
jgi:hypothetical protein